MGRLQPFYHLSLKTHSLTLTHPLTHPPTHSHTHTHSLTHQSLTHSHTHAHTGTQNNHTPSNSSQLQRQEKKSRSTLHCPPDRYYPSSPTLPKVDAITQNNTAASLKVSFFSFFFFFFFSHAPHRARISSLCGVLTAGGCPTANQRVSIGSAPIPHL